MIVLKNYESGKNTYIHSLHNYHNQIHVNLFTYQYYNETLTVRLHLNFGWVFSLKIATFWKTGRTQ